MADALQDTARSLMDAYWRAANYLSVGQIYLYDNPLLKKTLTKEHIKPRLLGHWGTTPGLNFIYVHLNRLIKKHDLDMIYITGPGHGGPGLVAVFGPGRVSGGHRDREIVVGSTAGFAAALRPRWERPLTDGLRSAVD